MTFAISIVLWLAKRLGLNLTGFAGGAIVAGLVATGFAAYSGYLLHVGYEWASAKSHEEALRKENAQLLATLAERQRQIAAAESVSKRDTERADAAEVQAKALKERIDATPVNTAVCFDRSAAGRVRDVR